MNLQRLPEERRKTLVSLLSEIEATKDPKEALGLKENFLMEYRLVAASGDDISGFYEVYKSILKEREFITKFDKVEPTS